MSNSANTQQHTGQVVEKEEKVTASVKVKEPLKFDSNIKCCFKNTIELASVIDGMFSPAMRDYVGCKISYNNGQIPQNLLNDIPYGKLYVSLYFRDRSDSSDHCPIINVINRFGKKNDDADMNASRKKFNSLMAMSGKNAGRMYDITPETYEALDEYRFFPNRKTTWYNLTSEVVSNFGYAGIYNQEIVACITGLDLEKLLNAIYGSRTEDGIFQYQAVPVQIVANANGEYVVQITQLDVNTIEDLRKQLGGPITRTEFHQCVR